MTQLVGGREVLEAIAASAERARDIGYDEAIRELGFDPDQMRRAAQQDAIDWMHHVPLTGVHSIEDLIMLIAGANLAMLIHGVRLGRLYDGRDPVGNDGDPR